MLNFSSLVKPHQPNQAGQVAWRQVEAAERLERIRAAHHLPQDGAIPHHILVAHTLHQLQQQQGEGE